MKLSEEKLTQMRKLVASANGKITGENRKKKYLDPSSSDYDPDYFRKMRLGQKLSK